MFDKNGSDVPGVVRCMSDAELQEFLTWCRECCGYDPDEMTYNQLQTGAARWFDELFIEANPELFPEYFPDH